MFHRRSIVTRLLHLMLLLAVSHQLIGSNFIEKPLPGEAPALAYTLHTYVGLAGFVVVLAFWIWCLVRRGETDICRLVPWFSRRGWRALRQDFALHARMLAALRLPEEGEGAIASAMHGLGLMIVTFMAGSGSLYYLAFEGTAGGRLTLLLHKASANLMWAYLIAHATIALAHHLQGSDILSRMFWSGRRTAGMPQTLGNDR